MIAKTSQQQVSPEPSREKRIYATTLIGSAVNLLLTAGKIVAGVLGQSGAMMADGLHSLSDLVSDFIVLALIKVSSKKQDADHNYGHGKYETMAAVCIGILLLFVSIELLSTGCAQIYKVIKGEPLAAPSAIALWAALISIASKEAGGSPGEKQCRDCQRMAPPHGCPLVRMLCHRHRLCHPVWWVLDYPRPNSLLWNKPVHPLHCLPDDAACPQGTAGGIASS